MKKRICAVIMCLLLAVNLVGAPKAKAVVSEGALLGSIFGSLLVSMGYSWAASNMDMPTFGEAIYKLIQEHDEANKDTGVQLIRDLNIAALTSGRPGTIQFNYAWTQAASSFAAWFYEKYGLSSNSSAQVIPSSASIVINGKRVSLTLLPDGTEGGFSITAYPLSLGANIFDALGVDVFSMTSGEEIDIPVSDGVTLVISATTTSARLYWRWYRADGTKVEQTACTCDFTDLQKVLYILLYLYGLIILLVFVITILLLSAMQIFDRKYSQILVGNIKVMRLIYPNWLMVYPD